MLIDKPLSIDTIFKYERPLEQIKNILNVAKELMDANTGGSVTIAVTGDWGSGKTTILKGMESFFRDLCSFPVVFFEVWKYHKEKNPLVPLILQIRDSLSLKASIKGKLTRIAKPLSVIGLNLADLVLKLSTQDKLSVGGVMTIFKEVEDIQENLKSRYKDNIEALRGTIGDLIKNYDPDVNKDQPYRTSWQELEKEKGNLAWRSSEKKIFVLLIDDLDRLVPKKAFAVIEELRFYFDIDNVLIVMGVNDRILNGYVEKYYGITKEDRHLIHNRGEKFIDKIFHWNFEIPFSMSEAIHLRSLETHLEERELEALKILLQAIDHLPHRRWVKLVNRIEKKCSLAFSNDIYEIVFAAFLKELFPDFELFSRRFPLITSALYNLFAGEVFHFLDFTKRIKDEDYSEGLPEEVVSAVKIILDDKTYLDLPERNIITFHSRIRGKKEEV